MLEFRIANKIFALQPCGWCATRFPSESALCRTLYLAPYLSSIYVPIYAVKQRQILSNDTACERLSGTRGGHGRILY